MSRPIHPMPRRLRAVLMVAAGAMLALVVSQCRMVDDNVVAPGGFSASRLDRSGECITACARAYADSNRVEADLHVQIIHACGGDPICEGQEDLRHALAVQRISAGRIDCVNACHHQGGGTGGR